MLTAALIYFLAHIGAVTAPPATINFIAGAAVVENLPQYTGTIEFDLYTKD